MAVVGEVGDPPPGRLDLGHPATAVGDGGRATDRRPRRGTAGQVVGVDLGDVERVARRRRSRRRGQGVVVGASTWQRQAMTPGRGLAVGPGVGVDPASATGTGRCPALDHRGLAEERRLRRDVGELRRELAEREVLGAVADEVERRDVPEAGRPAVAEDDHVPLREGEEGAEPVLDPGHEVLHRLLPVGRAEDGASDGCQVLHLLGAHLARPAAETTVGGQQVRGDGDRLGSWRSVGVHCRSLAFDRNGTPPPVGGRRAPVSQRRSPGVADLGPGWPSR